MKHLTIICLLIMLFSCDKKQHPTKSNTLKTYLNSLTTLPTPLHFSTTDDGLADLSPAYDSILFTKYKHIWAYRPYGKIIYDDSTVAVIDIVIGDVVVPLLTTFDQQGNKVDSLNLFARAASDIGFVSNEFVTITGDKRIIISDSTTRWDLNATGDDIIEGTQRLTVETFIYALDERGAIKLTNAPLLAVRADSEVLPGDSTSADGATLMRINFPLDSLLHFDSEAELKNVFGADVQRSTGYYPEGMGEYANTLLFPGSRNQVEFVWKDDSITFSGLAYIEIDHDSSEWKTKEGIAMNTTLKELEKLNGKPFSFFGFGWDYAGATEWEGGYLDKRKIFVRLKLPGGNIPVEFDGLLGDRSFPSDSSLAQRANPVVGEITMRR